MFNVYCVLDIIPVHVSTDSRTEVDGRVRLMLQALANEAGFQIEFEDTSDSEDSEYETEEGEGESNEEGEELVGNEGEGNDKGEGEEGGREKQVKRNEGDGTSSCSSSVADGDCRTLPNSASNTTLLPQNNTCLHNNIDDTPTSSGQASCENIMEKQVNGRTEIESVDSIILTCTCNDTYFLQTAVGACESRKRHREDTDETIDGSEPSKRPCRYHL